MPKLTHCLGVDNRLQVLYIASMKNDHHTKKRISKMEVPVTRFDIYFASFVTQYQIYLACADNGNGYDITRPGELLLTFDEWLDC